jgi:hypothetical protein
MYQCLTSRHWSLRYAWTRPVKPPLLSFWKLPGGLESWAYDVDLEERTVAYKGCNGEEYIEAYPAVTIV